MIRTVVEERSKNIAVLDVFSKLSQNRILYIDDVIEDELANGIIAQLLYLDSISNSEITIMINSPGGSIYQGFGIIDMMNKISSPIKTVAIGVCASMAAAILTQGAVRQASPTATMMLHQPSHAYWGKYSDIEVSFDELKRVKDILYNMITSKTDVTPDMMEKDLWLSADRALELKVVDIIK